MDGGLRQGAIGWLLLASLGVSYVIAGDYSAWNFGMQHGGWGGLALAVVFGAAMYFALLASLAELATIIPEAGGGSAFAERAFGPVAACITGGCIFIEYCAAAAVVAVFVGAYTRPLLGIGGAPVIVGVFLLFVAIHAAGVGEAMRVLLGMALIALLGLIVFVASTAPSFHVAHLTDIAPQGLARTRWLPHGWLGVWAALPFGTAFFLAVEGVAMAAEETRDPQRNLPRGMFAALAVLTLFAIAIVLAGPGAAGARALQYADDPIVAGLQVAGVAPWVVRFVNVCGLAGLLACLFSAIYGYSRLAFALARAGYLPAALARTNRRRVPLNAIIAPGVLACTLALTGAADQIFVMMVSAGTLSYLLMLPAHWIMRRREPGLPRPYRTPGGTWTVRFAWGAAALSFVACFVANPLWSAVTLALLGLFLAGYALRRRRQLQPRG
ncbi:MAG: amino acid permease [Gammaproteobacteria bacterium]|nr:amino acid permease [Gammaproteobacteria bacterium]